MQTPVANYAVLPTLLLVAATFSCSSACDFLRVQNDTTNTTSLQNPCIFLLQYIQTSSEFKTSFENCKNKTVSYIQISKVIYCTFLCDFRVCHLDFQINICKKHMLRSLPFLIRMTEACSSACLPGYNIKQKRHGPAYLSDCDGRHMLHGLALDQLYGGDARICVGPVGRVRHICGRFREQPKMLVILIKGDDLCPNGFLVAGLVQPVARPFILHQRAFVIPVKCPRSGNITAILRQCQATAAVARFPRAPAGATAVRRARL